LESQHGQLLLTAHRNVGRQTFAQQNGVIHLAAQPTAADREGGDRPDTCERAGEELLASVLSVDNALKHTLLHAQRGTIDLLLYSIRVFEGVKLDGDPTLWGDLR